MLMPSTILMDGEERRLLGLKKKYSSWVVFINVRKLTLIAYIP
jgi:hypothetical protein